MMRYERKPLQTSSSISFNAVPMVDVIFMLTIFFMLVSRFSSAEQIPMELPKPEHSQASVAKIPERVIINCRVNSLLPTESVQAVYSVGPNKPESLDVVARRLAAMRQRSPNMKVIVRADRRLPYAEVREVMRMLADNHIDMLNVVAHVDEEN